MTTANHTGISFIQVIDENSKLFKYKFMRMKKGPIFLVLQAWAEQYNFKGIE